MGDVRMEESFSVYILSSYFSRVLKVSRIFKYLCRFSNNKFTYTGYTKKKFMDRNIRL